MKPFYTTVISLFIALIAQAQIPNPSFENWANGSPVDWTANNGTGDSLIVISNTAHSGQHAVDMKVNQIEDNTFGSVLQSTGVNQSGFFPVTSAPLALYGWYISSPKGGDIMAVTSYAQHAVQEYAGVVNNYLSDTTAVYKQFAFNYIYPAGTAADSVSIQFQMVNSFAQDLTDASYFIIDDLSFGPLASGLPVLSEAPSLEKCSPNPANANTTIIYSLSGPGIVQVAFYDLLGKQVQTLLKNTLQTPGRYKISADVSALPAGVYFCTLNINGQTCSQKLLVTR